MCNTRPPIDHIERTRAAYDRLGYPPYRWVKSPDPPPWSALHKPLARSRLALIASGGIYACGQVAFHHHDDTSLRVIEEAEPKENLRATHFAYDLSAARRDPDAVFPRETLRRAVARGELGELAPSAFTFMGGIYSSRKVRELVAPALRERLLSADVDLALLVPV